VDFTPSEEQVMVAGLATSLFATATPAELASAGFDQPLWAGLGAAGLLGLPVPEDAGGGGLDLAAASVVAQECGRVAGRVPVVAQLAALATVAAAGRPQDAALLAAGAAGETVMVPALAEAGVGDPWRPTLTARRGAGGWVLDGTRLAVAWAREAAHLVVSASTDDGGLLLVLLPTSRSGVVLADEVVSSEEPHATVTFDGVRIEDGEVLAEGAAGAAAVEAALTRSTLLQCAHAVGVGETALRLAAAHVSEREQFGRPLATFQAVTVQVADCWIDIEAMRLTMQQALWRFDQGLPSAQETAVAAFWAADGVHRVVETAVHLHGGLGVDVSYPLHRWYLAGKVDELSLGGAARQLERLGDLLAAR
jgi:alkylation response protein AidB-like acyl-CoA dehydrogenase